MAALIFAFVLAGVPQGVHGVRYFIKGAFFLFFVVVGGEVRRCSGALMHDLAFTEIFSGPRAPLTYAVVERLSGSIGS